jgi:hypothetical protein
VQNSCDTLAMLTRCRVLALRAMLEAGGHIVRPAAPPPPPPRRPSLAPAYRPRRSADELVARAFKPSAAARWLGSPAVTAWAAGRPRSGRGGEGRERPCPARPAGPSAALAAEQAQLGLAFSAAEISRLQRTLDRLPPPAGERI